ncbi:DUF4832 domain-containing protein [Bacillus sp. FJAT-26390]|uniref:DUF4832 domain-containing protein n=1 Tax=Bacillus sp. FJAT-26390 TaxID=1743142 RepID=UPI000807D9CA|nr:DUF4832 domain-containing protein [Bacillus sp. FJAT-26390]OBZ17126.1 DUF4832 domain-containing protein [Bacillus sp. FJAT-26390]
MGKYSLESYEKYKSIKIRPNPLPRNENLLKNGPFTYVSFSWVELEPTRGEYRLEKVKEAISTATNPILVLKPDLPLWVKEHANDCFAALIRKVGSYIDTVSRLAGVVISTLAESNEEWSAYIDSFEELNLLADLHNERLIHYLREHSRGFGLLVKCSEHNWIACCEAFAKQKLQHVWKSYPVVLHITDNVCGPHIRRESYRWHASLSNLNAELGYSLALRRLTYPETVSSEGSLPLRFWFVNTGSARVYREFSLWVKLEQGDVSYELPMRAATQFWLTGDLVHNEIIQLPNMEPGNYKLSIALFFKDRSYIKLDIQSNEQDGYYEAGTVEVKVTSEDPLLNIWDSYYPEGYYPLEDPKVPE